MSDLATRKRSPALRRPRRGWLAAALAGLVAAAAPGSARSDIITFADFNAAAGTPFTFTSNGAGASFTGTAPVVFDFTGLAGVPTGHQDATLALTATALTPASALGGLINQPVDGPSNTLTITRNSDGLNLLSVTFQGSLAGLDGSPTANLFADSGLGNPVAYSSAFLDASGWDARSFGLTLLPLAPAFTVGSNGYLADFTTGLSGTFTGGTSGVVTAAVPEPGSLALAAVGAGALGAAALLRRRSRR